MSKIVVTLTDAVQWVHINYRLYNLSFNYKCVQCCKGEVQWKWEWITSELNLVWRIQHELRRDRRYGKEAGKRMRRLGTQTTSKHQTQRWWHEMKLGTRKRSVNIYSCRTMVLKVRPQSSFISITWELVGTQILEFHCRLKWSKKLWELGLAILV